MQYCLMLLGVALCCHFMTEPGDAVSYKTGMSVPEPPTFEPSLLGDYRSCPGSYDELTDQEGQVRPHWASLVESLQRFSPEELDARQESTQRVIREHGATYNVYADGDRLGRPWSLDLLPLVISAREWRHIEAGLTQRSHLLNSILADIYGPQQLLKRGLIPPALLYANPDFLRPCHGVRPLGKRFLFLHAVDLARGADGSWWVLADRTQAPSGAGYTLENRPGAVAGAAGRISGKPRATASWIFRDSARYLARSGAERQRYAERGTADARTVQ